MVELRLASVEDRGMPEDCYVSVRIGEAQKLSRLSSSRVYRFPKAGDRRQGKIEVFRRIGACNVDVDPGNKQLREVSISCLEAGFGTLGLKVEVAGEDAMEQAPAEGKKDGSKVKAAKEYLNTHGLEVRLSEAMQAVLRERPADPAQFLAGKLMEERDRAGGVKLPPLNVGNKDNSGMGMPVTQSMSKTAGEPQRTQARPQKLEPLSNAPVQAAAPKAASAAAVAPKQVLPFKDFYKANFQRMGSDAFARCYSKFPTNHPKPAVPKAAAAAVKAVLPFPAFYKANFQRMESDAFARCYSKFPTNHPKPAVRKAAVAAVKAVLPFPAFYKANFQRMESDAFARCYSKFPTKHPKPTVRKAEVAAVKAVLPFPAFYKANFQRMESDAFARCYSKFPAAIRKPAMPKATPASTMGKMPPQLKPSVGTWLNRIPPTLSTKVQGCAAPTVAAAKTAAATFKLKPSVGTWLVQCPPVLKKEKVETTTQVKSYTTIPSVGTWLKPLPKALRQRNLTQGAKADMKESAKVAWVHKPSIGTWLAKAVP